MKKLPVHDGCVNTICWNKTGEHILSGSDDCNLCITKPNYLFDQSTSYTVLHKIPTHHLGNIFCARFMPNSGDTKIVSCSSQGPVIVHDIYATDPSEGLLSYNCHSSTIYEVLPIPDNDRVFLSCSEDKTLRLFDIRVHSSCSRASSCGHPELIRNSEPMTTLNLHPLNSNLILVGRSDGLGQVYDRRRLPDPAKFSREKAHAEYLEGKHNLANMFKYRHPMDGVVSQFKLVDPECRFRITSLCYNGNGSQVLASYSGEYLYLFDHDASSNMELIQTLPLKSTATRFSNDRGSRNDGSSLNSNTSENNDDDNDDDHDHDHDMTTDDSNTNSSSSRRISDGVNNDASNNSNSSNSDSNNRASFGRNPRIRIRGDWSDTGVNSVPRSRRTATSILERMANTLNVRYSNLSGVSRGRAATSRDTASRRSELDDDDHHHHQQQTDESNEDQSMRSGWRPNWRLINEEDETGNDDDDEDDDEDSDEDETIREEEINSTTATSTSNTTAESSRDSAHVAGQGGSSSERQASKWKGIKPETKAKFKQTMDGLHEKYHCTKTQKPRIKYQGHRNCRTSIKEAIFWGDDYVMSGSDCGRVFIWHKETAQIVSAFQADERVVNCLAPNPYHYALATSGIDYDIKLWSTQPSQNCGLDATAGGQLHPTVSTVMANDEPLMLEQNTLDAIVNNNEVMLEESRQTFSLPPHLFFRVLATLARS